MKRRIDIEVLRILCIIIVVLFHTSGRYSHPDIATPLPEFFKREVNCAIWIAVPMFLFISGFLFSKQIKRNKYPTYFLFINKKAQRLLIPYVCFSTIIMISSGFFDIMEIFRGGFWHLWFLPTLFCCFTLYYLVFRNSHSFSRIHDFIILIISFALSLIHIPEQYCFLGIDGALKWGVYFVLGMITANHEALFRISMKKYMLWIPLLLIWIINSIFYFTPYMQPSWNNTIAVSACILSIFYIFQNIKLNKLTTKFILSISNASMGIYILHYWVLIYATSTTSFHLIGCFNPISVPLTIFLVIAISIIVIIISYIGTITLKMNQITKPLIG